MLPELQQAVARAHSGLEQRTRRHLQSHDLQVNCRKGCFFCCYALVMVGLAEAEYLRLHIAPEQLKAVDEIGRERLGRIATVKHESNFATAYFLEANPCPLLTVGGACSAYPARPLACRGVLTNLQARYCAPGAVLKLKGKAKAEYQKQLHSIHGPEHYLRVPWQSSKSAARQLWSSEQRIRGFTVIGELASLVYLVGQRPFQKAIKEGLEATQSYLEESQVLGGDWGFWVG